MSYVLIDICFSVNAADIIHFGEAALIMVYPDGGVLLAPSTTSFSSQCHLGTTRYSPKIKALNGWH